MTKHTFDVVIVGQGGNLKQASVSCKEDSVDSEENKQQLYKACGYKLSGSNKKSNFESFELLHIFDRESFPKDRRHNCGLALEDDSSKEVLLFGKKDGKAASENKYEFPPPIDNDIFFGNLCLVKCLTKDNKNDEPDRHFLSLRVSEWTKYYEALFGGFDECNDSDENDEEDLDVLDFVSDKKKTKDGYLKDGFIVDDNEDDEDDYDEYAETELSDEEDFEFSDDD